MYYFLLLVRCLILAFSMLGYALFCVNRLKIKPDLIPVLVSASIALTMYLAGLLNLMKPMVWIIVLVGIASAVWFAAFKRNFIDATKQLATPGIFFFAVCVVFVFLLCRGSRLISYDNFSHWGLIVKQMWIDERLPNFSNTLIFFPTYPPGSAMFLYFVTTVLYRNESQMLMAQNILLLSCIAPLFSFIKNPKNIFAYLILLPTAVFVAVFALPMNSLLVDALLPLLAFANTAIVLKYRDNLKLASFLSFPVMGLTILVKNSGIFFVLANAVLLLLLWIKKAKSNKFVGRKPWTDLLHVAVPIFLAFLLLVLWNKHVDLVFPSETENYAKHAMNAEHYTDVIQSKSREEILKTRELFVQKLFDTSNIGTRVYLGWNAVIILSLVLCVLYRGGFKRPFYLLIGGNLLYIAYQFSSYCMYQYSMPAPEALSLASYDRYHATILIYLVAAGSAVLISLVTAKNNKFRYRNAAISICACALLSTYLYTNQALTKLLPTPVPPDSPIHVIDKFSKSAPYSGKSYVIYSPLAKNDAGYRHYYLRYRFYTEKIKIIHSVESAPAFLETVKGSDYLIVLEEDQNIAEVLKPFVKKDSYIGCYASKDLQ